MGDGDYIIEKTDREGFHNDEWMQGLVAKLELAEKELERVTWTLDRMQGDHPLLKTYQDLRESLEKDLHDLK